jgi:hypothetical protein
MPNEIEFPPFGGNRLPLIWNKCIDIVVIWGYYFKWLGQLTSSGFVFLAPFHSNAVPTGRPVKLG